MNTERYGFDSAGQLRVAIRSEFFDCLTRQIPRDLHDKLEVRVETDAYMIRCVANITDTRTQKSWSVALEEGECAGQTMPCKLPDAFVSMLCVAV